MDLKQLSELGGEVNVTVRLEDLRQWHKELTAVASPPSVMPVPQHAGELYTRKQDVYKRQKLDFVFFREGFDPVKGE